MDYHIETITIGFMTWEARITNKFKGILFSDIHSLHIYVTQNIKTNGKLTLNVRGPS